MTLKDHMYLPSGSDDSDWSVDIIPPSHNAMESSMLSIFEVSKMEAGFIQQVTVYSNKIILW